MAAALSDDTWIRDLAHGNTTAFITEVVALARLIRSLQPIITQGATDLIKWNLEASGNYSASSAYKAQFQGCCSSNFRELIWQAWGSGKLKFFSWLLHLNRLWCNDRLQRRGWENPYFCQLCLRSLESSEHLFWQCPFSTQVWCSLASWTGCEAILRGLEPQLHSSTDRITRVVEDTTPASRKGIKSIILLATWEIWLERNRCTFNKKVGLIVDVIGAIRHRIDLWRQAGATCLQQPFAEPPAGIG